MIFALINIGLVATAFILVPGRVDPAREPKMAVAAIFALIISLWTVFEGKIKPFRNKYALIMVAFAFIAYYLSPPDTIKRFGIESGRFWSWEPLFYNLVFLLFLVSISSLEFTKKHIDNLLDTIVYCGLAMGILVALQSIRIDQFFEWRFGTYGYMAGTLGNPTLVGPYLGMIIPIALYRRRWCMAWIMAYSTLATCSNVALLGMVLSLALYIGLKSKKLLATLFTGLLVLGVIASVVYVKSPEIRRLLPDNERFLTWTQIATDLNSPVMLNSKKTYVITGIGAGSFKYIFHSKNNQRNDNFLYAHNDWMQVAYEYGLIGAFLFVAAFFWIFKRELKPGKMTLYRRALLSSLFCACVCAGGIFIFQIGTHIYLGLIVAGLLHNEIGA